MGWRITIGNALPVSREKAINDEDGEGWACYGFSVERVEQPNAPLWEDDPPNDFVDISGKTNGRHPSYISFSNFLKDTGLTGKIPAFGNSEGCFVLRASHRDAVRDARNRWAREHPGAIAGWLPNTDSTLAKLIWYEWWMTWALENCERPAIEMS